MRQTARIFSLLAATALAAALSSCAQKEAFSSLDESGSSSSSGPKVVQSTPRVSQDGQSDSLALRSQRGNILTERLVFFDYDKSFILDEYRALINAHTELLSDNRATAVILQGHADERGSTEYNLALGQRRSDAVRDYMVSGGAFPDQVEAISYGEERPRAFGANESAWAENRRVEIVYSDE